MTPKQRATLDAILNIRASGEVATLAAIADYTGVTTATAGEHVEALIRDGKLRRGDGTATRGRGRPPAGAELTPVAEGGIVANPGAALDVLQQIAGAESVTALRRARGRARSLLRTVGAALVLVVALASNGAAACPPGEIDSRERLIERLESELADAHRRIAALESLLRRPSSAPAAAAPPTVDRLIVERIERYRGTGEHRRRAAALRAEAENILTAHPEPERDRGKRIDPKLIRDRLEAEKRARALVIEAERIEAMVAGSLWICGWDGRRDVMLLVHGAGVRRLSERLQVGDVVRWRSGSLVEFALGRPADSDFDIIATDRARIDGGSAPARPAGRVPVWAPTVNDKGGLVASDLPRLIRIP